MSVSDEEIQALDGKKVEDILPMLSYQILEVQPKLTGIKWSKTPYNHTDPRNALDGVETLVHDILRTNSGLVLVTDRTSRPFAIAAEHTLGILLNGKKPYITGMHFKGLKSLYETNRQIGRPPLEGMEKNTFYLEAVKYWGDELNNIQNIIKENFTSILIWDEANALGTARIAKRIIQNSLDMLGLNEVTIKMGTANRKDYAKAPYNEIVLCPYDNPKSILLQTDIARGLTEDMRTIGEVFGEYMKAHTVI